MNIYLEFENWKVTKVNQGRARWPFKFRFTHNWSFFSLYTAIHNYVFNISLAQVWDKEEWISRKVKRIKSWKANTSKKPHNPSNDHFSNDLNQLELKPLKKKKKEKKKTTSNKLYLSAKESRWKTQRPATYVNTTPHPFGRKLPCSPTDQTSNAEDRITEVAGSADPCRLFVLVA